jgi:hypothetical protein
LAPAASYEVVAKAVKDELATPTRLRAELQEREELLRGEPAVGKTLGIDARTMEYILGPDASPELRGALRQFVDDTFRAEDLNFFEALESFDRQPQPNFKDASALMARFINAG